MPLICFIINHLCPNCGADYISGKPTILPIRQTVLHFNSHFKGIVTVVRAFSTIY